jgi:hypothetical protein
VIYNPEMFVTFSKDREAVERLAYWQQRRRDLPWRKRGERAEAEQSAAAARQRCIDAGIDWDAVPKPPDHFQAPDRSARRKIGAVDTETPLGTPGQAGRPLTVAAAGRGGGPALAGGAAGFAGGLAGAAAWSWLRSGTVEPIHQGADGSSYFQAADGSYWYENATGNVFGMADGGSWLALDNDGFLWGLDGGGSYVTWAADGAVCSLADDGSLFAVASDGSMLALGEDGSWFMEGADGSMYTADANGNFWGFDDDGNWFEPTDGSGFSQTDLAGYGDYDGNDDDGSLLDSLFG